LPQETGLTRALNFTKGLLSGAGDRGADSLARRGAPRVYAFTVEGPLPEAGAKIVADEKEVGEITSSAILPLPGGDRAVALGYLRREAAGKDLIALEWRSCNRGAHRFPFPEIDFDTTKTGKTLWLKKEKKKANSK
jgi:hypothetical protein